MADASLTASESDTADRKANAKEDPAKDTVSSVSRRDRLGARSMCRLVSAKPIPRKAIANAITHGSPWL